MGRKQKQQHQSSLPDADLAGYIEALPFSTEVFSPEGDCLRVNTAWQHLWRMPRSVQEGCYNMLRDPSIQSKHVWPFLSRGFRGEASHSPLAYYDPAEDDRPGRPRLTDGFIFPVHTPESEQPRKVVLILRDHTEERLSQNDLRELRRKVEELEVRCKAAEAERVRAMCERIGAPLATPSAMPDLANSPRPDLLCRLTPRELQIAIQLARGYKPPEVARMLAVTPKVIYAHRASIYQKLNVTTDCQLLLFFAGTL